MSFLFGGGKTKTPSPPPTPPPEPTIKSQPVQYEVRTEKERRKRMKGQLATILTTRRGLLKEPETRAGGLKAFLGA